ncbi:hypothetical protein [Pseudomonas sp. SO81]|uniref:hypothetical protein n=1 Tax=Pseudomonas sp. SO81 TaxID=2983246 RepID=UPI0025A4A44A|nr:hypothetical protein [Pseudomonas sp. SO81]
MNGLFTRLAAQASGRREATLHSPASLPYRGALEQPSLESSPTALPETPEAYLEQPSTPLTASHQSIPDQPAMPVDSEGSARDATHVRSSSARVSAPEAPADIVLPEPLAPLRQPASGAPDAWAIPPAEVAQPTPTIEPRADAAKPEHIRAAEPHAQLDMTGAARADSLQTGIASQNASGALPLPTNLLSPRAVPVRQAAAPAAPSAVKAPPQQADEVHIHIGRIEVTAIQESAPSKRETRKGPAPLSLDDYLAKRKGDGR